MMPIDLHPNGSGSFYPGFRSSCKGVQMVTLCEKIVMKSALIDYENCNECKLIKKVAWLDGKVTSPPG